MAHKHTVDEFESIGDLTVCFYCGQPCDSVDHVTPRATLKMMGGEIENPVTSRYETVDACRECNCALGDGLYTTLSDRKRAAKEYLRRKYKKYLSMPDWSDSELDELGYTLRSHIKRNMAIKKLTRMRLDW